MPKKTPARDGAQPQPNDLKAVNPENEKTNALASHTADATNEFMTTDHGVRINDDQNSLKAGERGPSLLEDFILREKITHFDHERIPERVVHARGSEAHNNRYC